MKHTSPGLPTLLSREEAASALGVKIAEVDRLIAKGELRSVTDRSGRGRPAKRVYEEDVSIILQQARKTAKDAPSPSYAERFTPEDASRMFSALKSGTSVEDCVISLKIHPSAAMAIKRAWDQVRGQITLDAADLRRLEKMGLDGSFPIESGEGLMDLIETAARGAQCVECKTRAASMCRLCSAKSGVKSRELGASTGGESRVKSRESGETKTSPGILSSVHPVVDHDSLGNEYGES